MYYYYCTSCLAVLKFATQLNGQDQNCATCSSGSGTLAPLHGKLFSYCTKCVKIAKQKQTCSGCKSRNIKVVFPDGKGISGSNISKSLKLKSQDLVTLYNAYYETSADTLFIDPSAITSAASTYALSTGANEHGSQEKGATKKKDQLQRKNNKTQRFNIQFSTIECVNCTIGWTYNFALQQYINANGEMYNFHSRKCGHCGNYTKAICSQCSKSISLSHIFSHYNQHNGAATPVATASSVNIAGATSLASFVIDDELNAMLDSVKQETSISVKQEPVEEHQVQIKQEKMDEESLMCDVGESDQEIFEQPGTITRSTSNSSSISTMSCSSSNSVLSNYTAIEHCHCSNNTENYCEAVIAPKIEFCAPIEDASTAMVSAASCAMNEDELMKDDLLEFCGEHYDSQNGGCCNLIAQNNNCCNSHSYDVECDDDAAHCYDQQGVFAVADDSTNQLDDDQFSGTNQSSFLVWQ